MAKFMEYGEKATHTALLVIGCAAGALLLNVIQRNNEHTLPWQEDDNAAAVSAPASTEITTATLPPPTSLVIETTVPTTAVPAAAIAPAAPASPNYHVDPVDGKVVFSSGLRCDNVLARDIPVDETSRIGDTLSLLKAIDNARHFPVIRSVFDEARAKVFVYDFAAVNGLTAAQVPDTQNFPPSAVYANNVGGKYAFYTNCVDPLSGNVQVA